MTPSTAAPAASANPERARRDAPPVVVMGAYFTGIALMRSLARRGVTTACIDCQPRMPGFRTSYGRSYLCPNPDEAPDAWLEFMLQTGAQIGGPPVLIPSSDRFITAVADHAELLRERFIFPEVSLAAQAILATKQRQYDVAAGSGLPVPRTAYITSGAELDAFAACATFPCLMKPRHFREWQRFPAGHPLSYQKVAIADSPEQFRANYLLAAPVTPQVVVQEIVQGPDTAKLVYLSCYGRDGSRLGACVVRQIRTDPIFFGSASIVEPAGDPEADRLCDAFLRSLGYVGLCEIELKRDCRDGGLRMIEANPRFSVTADAAPLCGIDLGWLHYLDLIGEPVVPVPTRPTKGRHIMLTRDFAAFPSYLRAGLLTWRGLLHSYRPPVRYFDFDPLDWRVTAATSAALAKLLVRAALRPPKS